MFNKIISGTYGLIKINKHVVGKGLLISFKEYGVGEEEKKLK